MARFSVIRLMHPGGQTPNPPSAAYMILDHQGKWPDFYLTADQMDEVITEYYTKGETSGQEKEESTTQEANETKEVTETNQGNQLAEGH